MARRRHTARTYSALGMMSVGVRALVFGYSVPVAQPVLA